jgi:flagellar FliL protein
VTVSARHDKPRRQFLPGKHSLTHPCHHAPGAKTAPEDTHLAKAAPEKVAADPEAGKTASRIPKLTGKRPLVIIAAAVLVLGLAAALWFMGVIPHPGKGGDAAAAKGGDAASASAPVYVDIPDIVANLNGGPHRQTYLKLTARLELERAADTDRVKAAMPRLQDLFQTYLREMRPEELRGSAGTYRLREELLGRANIAAAPARITDILFIQLLMQ